MRIELVTRFKSLVPPLIIEEFPRLAVIIGKSGAGKSHFLQALSQSLSSRSECIKVTPDKTWSISTLSGFGLGQYASVVTIMNSPPNELYDETQKALASTSPEGFFSANPIAKKIVGFPDERELPPLSEFARIFLYESRYRPSFDGNNLAHLFTQYRYMELEYKSRGWSGFLDAYGPAPWEKFNSLLRDADLPFKFTTPEGFMFGTKYEIYANLTSGETVRLTELSTGEQRCTKILMAAFCAMQDGTVPECMLLDEPDQGLHPSMIRLIMRVLQDTLVEKHGMNVVVTTHSPSTAALAPPESLFEMRREGDRLMRVVSRAKAIADLSDGFQVITRLSRVVFVESPVDARFYSLAFRIARDQVQESSLAQLTFVPVFLQDSHAQAGGRHAVERLVSTLREHEGDLVPMAGLVDRDVDPESLPGVVVLERRNLENLLIDPILIYACLMKVRREPDVNVELSYGDEHRLRSLRSEDLQSIANVIIAKIDAPLNDCIQNGECETMVSITYLSGQKIAVPKWLVEADGKRLMKAASTSLGGQFVNKDVLLEMFERVRLVPDDLLRVFEAVSTA